MDERPLRRPYGFSCRHPRVRSSRQPAMNRGRSWASSCSRHVSRIAHFDLFGVETRLGHVFACNHLADERRPLSENANVAHSRDTLDGLFDTKGTHLVPAHVDQVIPSADEVATIADAFHQITRGNPIGPARTRWPRCQVIRSWRSPIGQEARHPRSSARYHPRKGRPGNGPGSPLGHR